MNKIKSIALIVGTVGILILSGCAAISTAVSHRNLETQNKMSASIFLPPVEPSQQTVYVQVKNTTDKPDFKIKDQLIKALESHGYTVESDFKKAHYLLQVNVLSVGKNNITAAQQAFHAGYGGALEGLVSGAAIGAAAGDASTAVAGGVVGGIGSTIMDSFVSDVTFNAITDVQIGVRSKKALKVSSKTALKQGTGTSIQQDSTEDTHWKYYRTRILSTADQVNLDFKDAEPVLAKGIANSVSGIF